MILSVSLSSSHRHAGPQTMIERTKAAYAAGFASMSIGDHHNNEFPYAQNTPMLGRLLADWPDRPAGCLFLMPLWHPVLMAEQIGTLAATHAASFIVQTGLGDGQDVFAAFGTSTKTRGRVLEESIRMVKAMLAGEVVDSEMLGVTGGRVGLRGDHPTEWWIGADADVGIRRAATMGDAWYAGPSIRSADAGPKLEVYHQAGGKRAILRKDALVLADGDDARSKATELVERGYRGLTLDQLLVGNQDDVAEQLSAFESAGFEQVVVRCMSVPQDLALETLSLLGPLNQG